MCVLLHTSFVTQHGWSALMRVAWEGRTEAVTELAKAGADLNLQNNVCHFVAGTCTYSL